MSEPTPTTTQPRPVVKPPVRCHLRWVDAQRFEVGREEGPRVILDGHSKAGPGPVESLVNALTACISVDVIGILGKRREVPDWYTVDVVALRLQEVPAPVTSVEMTFRMRGAGITRANAERAIDLAVNRYCSVRNTIKPDIPVTWTLELEGDNGE